MFGTTNYVKNQWVAVNEAQIVALSQVDNSMFMDNKENMTPMGSKSKINIRHLNILHKEDTMTQLSGPAGVPGITASS